MAESRPSAGSPVGRRGGVARGKGPSSSPPRGLREAYERILDEENLAAEESPHVDAADEPDDSSRDWTGNMKDATDQLRASNRFGGDLIRRSASPSSLTRPTWGSTPSRLQCHRKPSGSESPSLDERTFDSGSGSGSNMSGLSSLENGTDDSFMRKLARHRRDQQRINGALKSERLVFSRARLTETARLTHEGVGNRDELDDIMATENRLAEASRSESPDPSDVPVHVPSAWGRKSRHRPDWRRRRHPATDESRPHRGGILERADAPNAVRPSNGIVDESVVDWVAAGADMPLPSVEDEPAGQAKPTRTAGTSYARPKSRSTERLLPPDIDQEFTATSIHISTSPIVEAKMHDLGRLREREIETVKGLAVTTDRSGRLHGRTSRENLERLQGTEETSAEDKKSHRGGDRRARASTHGASSKDTATELPPSIGKDGGLPTPPPTEMGITASVAEKHTAAGPGIERGGDWKRKGEEATDEEQASGSTDKPKADARDLLLQLARATSHSPSPTLEVETTAAAPTVNGTSRRTDQDSSEEGTRGTREQRAQGQRRTAERGAQDDIVDDDTTPRAEREACLGATPAVAIGGWIDTPAAAAAGHALRHRHASPSEATSDRGDPSLSIRDFLRGPNPSLPSRGAHGNKIKVEANSSRVDEGNGELRKATAFLLPGDRRSGGETRDNGHATIEALDKLLADETLDFTAPLLRSADGVGRLAGDDANDKVPSAAEQEERLRKMAYERVDERLESLLLSIRDAKQGIEVLEDKVGQDEPRYRPCPDCGHLKPVCSEDHYAVRIPKLVVFRCLAWIPFPRLCRRRNGRIRPTWFGVLCLVLWLYVLAETVTWCVLPSPAHPATIVLSSDPPVYYEYNY